MNKNLTMRRRWGLILVSVALSTLIFTVGSADPGFRPDGDAQSADISADGNFVAFESNASNLVMPVLKARCPAGRERGDFGRVILGICTHVYVRDMRAGRTRLIAEGRHPLISGDGRYLAYESGTGQVPGDSQTCSGQGLGGPVTSNCTDVFVRDLTTSETLRVSLRPNGGQFTVDSALSWISHSGNLVAFGADKPDGDSQLYIWTRSTKNVAEVAGVGGRAALTPDGRFVAFTHYGASLGSGDRRDCSLQNCQDIILLDRRTGRRALASKTHDGTPPNGPNFATASISADGRYTTFWSDASNLLPGKKKSDPQEPRPDVYVYDSSADRVSLVSVSRSGGFGNGFSSHPRITPDGRYVAFFSDADDLIPGDNKTGDVFVRDLLRRQTVRASVSASGEGGSGISTCCGDPPAISADGTFVAFSSAASNLAPGSEPQQGIFLRDVRRGATVLVSVAVAAPQQRTVFASSGRSKVVLAVVIAILVVASSIVVIKHLRRHRRDVMQEGRA